MTNKSERDKAQESLKKDFGEEGYKVLMDGVDAIIDITEKFGKPYKEVQKEIQKAYEEGLVKEKDGIIYGFKKKDKG